MRLSLFSYIPSSVNFFIGSKFLMDLSFSYWFIGILSNGVDLIINITNVFCQHIAHILSCLLMNWVINFNIIKHINLFIYSLFFGGTSLRNPCLPWVMRIFLHLRYSFDITFFLPEVQPLVVSLGRSVCSSQLELSENSFPLSTSVFSLCSASFHITPLLLLRAWLSAELLPLCWTLP